MGFTLALVFNVGLALALDFNCGLTWTFAVGLGISVWTPEDLALAFCVTIWILEIWSLCDMIREEMGN